MMTLSAWSTEVRRRLYAELPVEVFHRISFNLAGGTEQVDVVLLLANGSSKTFRSTLVQPPEELMSKEIIPWAQETNLY